MNQKILLLILLIVFIFQQAESTANLRLRRVRLPKNNGVAVSTATVESNAIAKGGSTAISKGVAISNALGTQNIKQYVANVVSNAVASSGSTAISNGKAIATADQSLDEFGEDGQDQSQVVVGDERP